MIPLTELEAAARLVDSVMPPTPQHSWPLLNARAGREVWVKHENHTPTGAFKVRAGITRIAALGRRRPQANGVINATRGNHGQSLAFACQRQGPRCVIGNIDRDVFLRIMSDRAGPEEIPCPNFGDARPARPL